MPLKKRDEAPDLVAEMYSMLRAAENDGQTPKRWVISPAFAFRLSCQENMNRMERQVFSSQFITPLPHDLEGVTLYGYPVTVAPSTLHDCLLDI